MTGFARQFALMHPAIVAVIAAAGVGAWKYYRAKNPPLIPGSNVPMVADVHDTAVYPGAIVAGSPDSTPGIPQSDYNAARAASDARWAFEPDLAAYYVYNDANHPPSSSWLDDIKNYFGW